MNYTNFGQDGNVMMAESGGGMAAGGMATGGLVTGGMADPDADLNIGPDMQYAQGGGYQMETATAVYNPQVDGPSFASMEEAAAAAAQQSGGAVASYDQNMVSSSYGQTETYGVEQNAMPAVAQ